MVVEDINGDGQITEGNEIAFAARTVANDTDLQALIALHDTNGDGKISAADTGIERLRLWKDANSNGITDAGELLTFAQAGLVSISGERREVSYSGGNADISAMSTAEFVVNGATVTRAVADVSFSIETDGYKVVNVNADGSATVVNTAGQTLIQADISSPLNRTLDTSVRGAIGSAQADKIVASAATWVSAGAGNDIVQGSAGDDWLRGGGGQDVLSGGDGNDTLVIDASDNVAFIQGGKGFDIALVEGNTGVTLDLARSTVEAAFGSAGADTLMTSGSGSVVIDGRGGNDIIAGSSASDRLSGGDGNDALRGASGDDYLDGGQGDDQLTGGIGNDVYLVDSNADVITELANEGIDSIKSYLAVTTLAANVEDLYLLSLNPSTGIGNELNNTIVGNAADNVLDGGVGADTLIGGAGDDIYRLDRSLDVVKELANEGIDTIEVGFNYTLASDLENLTLTGTVTVNGTGNSLNNRLMGNSANNSLSGGEGNDYLDGGAGADALAGGEGNDYLDGGAGADTLVGGAGNDTYVLDTVSDAITEMVGGGTDSVIASFTYTLSGVLENLTLSGDAAVNGTGNALDNVLVGNSAANILDGGDGVDTLDGGLGADTLKGGNGNDTYVVDDAGDQVIEALATGGWLDTVQSSISYTLGTNLEGLTLTGRANLNATGNALANNLKGNAGNNRLDGAGGADAMSGGRGDDLYIVDNVGDTVTESGNEGLDTVEAGVNYTLAANVENLTLKGAGQNGTGNELSNTILGTLMANTLDGKGGADTMAGGDGNDTYIVDDAEDKVIEVVGYGTDVVMSSVSYQLSDNVENLTLTGTGAVNATGNSLVNILTGNAASNLLDGGTGGDVMVGGTGNDTYIVDSTGDTVTESSTLYTEVDTVVSSISYSLGSNLENLVLAGFANDGTGNALSNQITGNERNNVLNGGAGNDTLIGGLGNDTLIGGAGVDVMNGGLGNDTYYIEAGDVFSEAADEGMDTIVVGTSYVLGTNFENLTLATASPGALTATGNASDNVITGNELANVLDGGAGVDTLIGGAGDDVYIINDSVDQIIETATGGMDTVKTTVDYVLSDYVDTLTLLGTASINGTGNNQSNTINGNSGDNQMFGGAGSDILLAGLGNDRLDGGTGADTMTGGLGDDIFVVDDILGDKVNEVANEGIDTVELSAGGSGYVLAANVENLVLLTGAYSGTGNASSNQITGNDSANLINGGAGTDVLAGGLGDDIYVVDNVSDVVLENASEGIDTIRTTVSYSLSDNVENLELTIGAATALNATGNALANKLTGNALANNLAGGDGNDTLLGGGGNDTIDGGTGADSMDGGDGADTYVVDDIGDVVVENTLQNDIDNVRSSISYTLGAKVENLTLLGVGSINATGNAFANILQGNDGNNVIDGGQGADTMRGGKGDDTYVLSELGDTIVENADEGNDTVNTYFTHTLSANVENATLTGASIASLTGNALNNTLIGSTANNTLDGGAGADTLRGGAGNDIYVVDNVLDVVTELAGEGADTVNSSVTYQLGSDLEDLVLTGNAAIDGAGNSLANKITGNALANVLDGGLGADTLIGGGGNDIYIVDNAGDLVTEVSGGGVDTVRSSINYSLTAEVENLTLLGTGNINGTGNIANNTITGNDGDNVVNGLTGSDTMIGGKGNDTYYVDIATDTVVEAANEGTDTVITTVSLTLAANLENLTLSAGMVINGTGNSADNLLLGNAAANILNGGTGADTMIGGAGNDTYVVDNTGDIVTETSTLASEVDTVQASVSYALGANLENLTLTGTASINGTGTSLNNVLTGNAADNIIDGGAGADTMVGGTGNDTYIVDNAADVTTEAVSAGSDTVWSSINWTLGVNLENLTLAGTSNINGTGNAVGNLIVGNAGNNLLDGGAGIDTLSGGLGNDTYVVDNAADVVAELADEGMDLVQSGVTHTLSAHVENLTLTGTAAINGTGNTLDNVITGNSGINVLTGGAGNDVYIVTVGDTTVELANAGVDTVQSAVTWTLSANLDNLTLTGSTAINGTGNELDNTLTGNIAANVLTGGAGNDTLNGGVGADSLVGGVGNDTYWLGRGYGIDTITENDATAGNTDIARFDSGIAANQLWFTKTGNNLDVSIIGTSDKFTLSNWYLGNQYHVEQFKTSDGKTLLDSQVQNLVSAMAAFAPPAAGQTTLAANYATALNPVIAANWQ